MNSIVSGCRVYYSCGELKGCELYCFRVQGNIIPVVSSRGVNSIISGCRVILFLW